MMEEQIRLALLGWCTGDGFGSQTEGMEHEEIAALGELSEVYSFEEHVPHSGITSYVSDLAILYALSFLELERVDYDHLRSTYKRYIKEKPEYLEPMLEESLSHPLEKGERTFHLSRSVVSGILSTLLSDSFAEREVALTSANTVVQEAALLYSQALMFLLQREVDSPDELFARLMRDRKISDEMKSIVQGSWNAEEVLIPSFEFSAHLRPSLLAVFSALKHAPSFEDGMITLAQGGGSTRLLCALYGGLAALLFEHVPESWVAELHVSSALDVMIKKQTLYRRETLTIEKIVDSLSQKLSAFEE